MNGEILFLAHRIPFPPDRGDKIRSHHYLRALARIAPVHVACLGETDGDMVQEGELAELSASHCLVHRSKPLPLAGVEALTKRKPVSLTAFHSSAIERFVADTIAKRPIAAIFVFSGQMGQYVPWDFKGRVVIDLCDVDSAKFGAYAESKGGPRSWIDAREERLLRVEEERLAHRADHWLLISEAEAQLLKSRMKQPGAASIRAMGNGIDADFFNPETTPDQPGLNDDGPHFVFTGQMDYAPNVSACQRATKHLMPEMRKQHPNAQFHIVGRAPSDAVLALDGVNGTHVWGEVPDVRPFLKSADAVLAPLTIARGVQNKVLEAMAMAKPVVLSPEAATGIDANDGSEFLIGPDDAALVTHLCKLVADKAYKTTLGNVARDYVIREKSWPAVLKDLPNLISGDLSMGEARHAA